MARRNTTPRSVIRASAISRSHPKALLSCARADFDPDVVYVSTLQRTSQTAHILFPEAKLVPVDGLKEMCFGSFEGRNFIEMEKDPEYQAWVKANCESPCPTESARRTFRIASAALWQS